MPPTLHHPAANKRKFYSSKSSNNLSGWILDFLTIRTQRVREYGTLSDSNCSSTGSPQGCVLSPLLFILYTNMCHSSYDNRTIHQFVQWCKKLNFEANCTAVCKKVTNACIVWGSYHTFILTDGYPYEKEVYFPFQFIFISTVYLSKGQVYSINVLVVY